MYFCFEYLNIGGSVEVINRCYKVCWTKCEEFNLHIAVLLVCSKTGWGELWVWIETGMSSDMISAAELIENYGQETCPPISYLVIKIKTIGKKWILVLLYNWVLYPAFEWSYLLLHVLFLGLCEMLHSSYSLYSWSFHSVFLCSLTQENPHVLFQ